ncbi:hypothetical protein N7456_011097 [Penicillium angulare]|uniref:Aminoglycoside phosphotransferase domain-containing protein n=1 Tax=Penicillium angulare TaxID=116970 RepID=A0A9W9JZV5_9EURO|nr:hypothetical protein N7456_011097 [Penicillium angulare]
MNTTTRADYEEKGLHSLLPRKVVRVSETIVVKSGGNIPTHEGPTLRFIKQNTTIPVPDVHDIRWKDGKVTELVMDYMPETPLDQVWGSLNHDQKTSIADQLYSYLAQRRELKGTAIGCSERGKALFGRDSMLEGGPFQSEMEFNEFILSNTLRIPDLLLHYAKYALFEGHNIIFTHGDIAPSNILVDGDQVTAILDWEYAGWYPEHWEYSNALKVINPVPGWSDYLAIILPPQYEKEYIGMFFLSRLLRH